MTTDRETKAILGVGCGLLLIYLAIWVTILVGAWLAIDKYLLAP